MHVRKCLTTVNLLGIKNNHIGEIKLLYFVGNTGSLACNRVHYVDRSLESEITVSGGANLPIVCVCTLATTFYSFCKAYSYFVQYMSWSNLVPLCIELVGVIKRVPTLIDCSLLYKHTDI